VPVEPAKAALSRLGSLSYFAAARAAIYIDFIGVDRHDSLGGSGYKALEAVLRQFENFGIAGE